MWLAVKYACFVLRHKWYVLRFGIKVGGIPLRQLLIHDLSKFSRAEFWPYCGRFAQKRPGGEGVRTPEYLEAWHHHWSHNPHHWEYWVRKDGVPDKSGEPVPMPEVYVREMVADWQAANVTYADISLSDWFAREYPKMILHPKTIEILVPLIVPLGLSVPNYGDSW